MTVSSVDLGLRVALKAELDLLRPVGELSPVDAGELFLLTKSKNTAKAYKGDLKDWFGFCSLVEVSVFEVDRRHMEVYLRHYLSKQVLVYTENDHAPLAIASVKRKVAAIRSFYKYCVDMQLVGTNPIPSDASLSVKGESPQPLGPDGEEAQAMLDAARTPLETAVVTVLLHQGLRVGEFCGLDVSDMRSVRGHRVLTLRRKGGNVQDQRMTRAAAAAVDALLVPQGRSEGPLVASETGARLTRDAVARIISEVTHRADIRRHYTPHSLRHSCVTLLLDAGWPIRDVQVFMGHASSQTTERYDLGRKVIDRSPAAAFDGGALRLGGGSLRVARTTRRSATRLA